MTHQTTRLNTYLLEHQIIQQTTDTYHKSALGHSDPRFFQRWPTTNRLERMAPHSSRARDAIDARARRVHVRGRFVLLLARLEEEDEWRRGETRVDG